MTTFTFAPSASSVFAFQPTLDGQTYNCTVTWNLAGQRWYLNIFALSGDLIVSRALVGSDRNSTPVNLAGGYFMTSVIAYYEDTAQIIVTP